MPDPYNLQRFLDAQAEVYQEVLSELRSGRKTSHWMWFTFPQLQGLGRSSTAQYFAIASLDEARAYLAHRVLGPRLRECTELVNRIENRTVAQVFGAPDDLKFRSSMTLFLRASQSQSSAAPSRASNDSSRSNSFAAALEKYFAGKPDPLTLSLLRQ